MNSSYQIPTSSSFASSYYRSFKEGTREIKPVSLHRCDDDFLTVIGLYDGFWKTVPENPENNFAHSHGGTAKKLYGSGGFSNAIQISYKGVAKIPRIFPGSDQFDEKRFYRDLITELRICLWEPMRNHPNIINLEDIQWFPGPHPSIENNWNYMWLTPEFEAAEGPLSGLLRGNPGIPFAQKIAILFDIAKALDCLHQHGVVHSDTKPDNIFIFSDSQRKYIAKVADFGCSTILKQEKTHGYLSGGTKAWSAPEAGERLNHEELCKTDHFSFGLVVWYVLTDGHGPFKWLESLCDTASLTHEDISSLKEDGCFLPLSLESLSELPLSEFEINLATEVLNATLCPKETRVRHLTPLFERYGHVLSPEE
jgi:serine/threonine protein kinase